MNEFFAYLQLGFEHITDPAGYDHVLFIVALCIIYAPNDWKKILVLVTAFTIGHSVTLVLSVLDIIQFDQSLIEKLIVITIILTCFANFGVKTTYLQKSKQDKSTTFRYVSAICFGLIHGMGFSSYLKSLLGKENFLMPLFSFNVGLELGQLLIVALVMAFIYLFVNVFNRSLQNLVLVVSGIVCGMAFSLLLERF